MDHIKRFFRDLSLRKSIVLYIFVFAILAIVLSAVTSALCDGAAQKITDAYPPTGEKFYLTNENGEQLGEGGYISKQSVPLSPKDKQFVSFLNFLPTVATPVYSALCILAAALLFYHSKLKDPLEKLRDASEKIAANNLDFQIDCTSKDELGQLCRSFEVMRSTLAGTFTEMWRQVEERRQLNAAFAHDLRTPLTVLKGYDEMLQTSADPVTKDTAGIMGKHISRLERYVDSMSRMCRLEDAYPKADTSDIRNFASAMADSAKILCGQNGKTVSVRQDISGIPSIDCSFISQVNNNLLSNAVRYAESTVQITYTGSENGFSISVSDDGQGFSQKVLHKAVSPYFTEEENHSEHFGLGLYICKILCEHHGGYLKLENGSAGADVTAFFKSLNP